MTNFTIAAVVVTCDRLPLLKENIECLRRQSRRPDRIIVVNNASADGTAEWLGQQGDLQVITQANTGSAGGQHTGIRAACDGGADWVWCMDDDCLPEAAALEELERCAAQQPAKNFGFLASKVLWSDRSPHRMNLPGYFFNKHKWNFIGAERFNAGVHSIDVCSFVSCLFNAAAIARVGLPNSDMFIWYDDLEYTLRFRGFENYYVAASVVVHNTNANASPGLSTVGGPFNAKKYYGLRNFYFVYRTRNVVYLLRFSAELAYRMLRSFIRGEMALATGTRYLHAVFDGLFGIMDNREVRR